MNKSKDSAKTQLLKLTKYLNAQQSTLNQNEFISVLEELKTISLNEHFVDTTIKSLKLLNQTKIRSKTKITNREEEVLILIGKGYQNITIAKELSLSKSTIETHRKNIRKKLSLKKKDNLMVYALIFNLQNTI